MTAAAVPPPASAPTHDTYSDDYLRQILDGVKTIATSSVCAISGQRSHRSMPG